MKKFLESLKTELQKLNVNSLGIEEIINDHRDMIESAIQTGLNEDEIISKFGDPKNLASELAEQEPKKTDDDSGSEDEMVLRKLFKGVDDKIKVFTELTFENITYQVSKDEDIHVFSKGLKNMDQYTVEFENNTLTLKGPRERIFGLINFGKKSGSIVVKIPNKQKVESLYNSGINSDVNLKGLTIESLTLKTINGKIMIEDAVCDQGKWHTVNGDVHVKSVKGGKLRSSQVSGDVSIQDVKLEGTLELDSVSGAIMIEDSTCARCDVKSVSGSLKGKEFYPLKLALRTVSGNILIENTLDKKIDVISKKSLSGDINIK